MNRQQVVSRLTKWYRILYVTPPFYVRNFLDGFSAGKFSPGGLRKLDENLFGYAPPKYLPFNYRFSVIEEVMQRARWAHLRMVCLRLKMRRPIVLLFHPRFKGMIGRFNESLICYVVHDQYRLFAGAGPSLAEDERQVLEAADLVICTSEPLREDKLRYNDNVHVVPNGVDYSLFALGTSPQLAVAPELNQIRRPILGFIGRLNDKVDYELLRMIAIDNPGWSIILVGGDNIYTTSYREQFTRALACGNVKWLGFRPTEELPAYLKGMDVCMIPNKVNEYTQYVYPIKLHEYLAAGKPVICSDMPSIRSFDGLVRIAGSVSEWGRHLRETVRETGPEWIRRRQAVALQNTWETRAEQVHALLCDTLETKAQRRDKRDGCRA